ncbi:glycosyltransferase, partial [Candidatus Saccharibacteria bacterium]|nr:glycosyltransferase [Candidatus Saccharibacteria bacterium]
KNILYVVGGLDHGGAESFIMNTLRNIDHEKYNFVIATFLAPRNGKKYTYADELKKMNAKIIRLKDTRFTRPWNFIKQFKQICEEEQIDIIHSHIDFMSALPLLGAKRAGVKKRISHSHNTFNPRLNNLFGRVMYHFYRYCVRKVATKRLACGQAAGRFLYGRRTKFQIVHNGITLKNFYFKSSMRYKMRKELGLKANDNILLTTARFEKQKNQGFLIDVLNLLDDNYKLVMVGDGSLRKGLEQKAKSYGLSSRVIFTGMRDDIENFYSLADYFVLPSHFEGFPTVCVEARTNGLKCIVSDKVSKEVGVLGDMEFLSINPVVSPSIWASYITENLPNPISKRSDMKNNKKIQKFDIKETTKVLEAIYDSR